MVVKSNQRKPVRILLVGDKDVGKTSLILSLVSEEFPENVPHRAEEITIPADVTPEQVPTNIIDYSTAEQTDDQLNEQIRTASVVCIVYAVDDDETIDRISSYWMPLIRQIHTLKRCPVVLVGNKIDLVDYSTIDGVFSIMDEFCEIETCIECSAKTLKNISEMFYYAQKAVLHPTSPIYSVENADLTDACKSALIRIFKICDMDCDGLLNDMELNNFQSRCFNAPLQPQVLDDVKAVLRKNLDDGVESNAVTLNGFLYLHCLFIQRGRNETTWTVLRKFGYNDELQMSADYLYPSLKVHSGSTTELSLKGQQFVTHLFDRFDKDRDRCLSNVEFEALFSTCQSPAWPMDESLDRVLCTPAGWLTYQGYMCEWAFMTNTNPMRTLEFLAYLGYNHYENESQETAIHVTRDRKVDLAKKQSSRNVYTCHVIGAKRVGKRTFCSIFIRPPHTKVSATASIIATKKQYQQELADERINVTAAQQNEVVLRRRKTSESGKPKCTVNTVQVYGQEKTMIMRSISVAQVSDPLLPSEVQCDVACLMYDINNPKSFEHVARVYIKYFAESKIPVLVIASKNDLAEVKQEYLLQPAAFCQKYRILPPQSFSAKSALKKDIFIKLATMAAFPRFQAAWILFYKHRNLAEFGILPLDTNVWWKAGLSIAAVTAVGFIVAKVLHSSSKVR